MKIFIESEKLYEMANVSKDDTKLPYNIWIDSAGSRRNVEHMYSPRVKVEVDGDQIPVSISDVPKILVNAKILKFSKVRRWIIKYKDVLLQHWNGEITDRQALNQLND